MTTQVNGTSGITFSDSSVQNTAAIGFRNRIINGGMTINQRGGTVTFDTGGTYMLDRWTQNNGGSAVITGSQSNSGPANSSQYSLQVSVTTGSAPAAGNLIYTGQFIEGNNVADLWYGTSSASTVTLSFWVKSSVIGTYCVALQNSAFNRSYVANYTVSVANTWEYKSVTIPGDQSGTWLITNGVGLRVYFDVGSGSNYNTTANTWAAGSYTRTSGAVSLSATTGANLYITSVQLEKATTASSFDFRSYGTELALCQRYFYLAPANALYSASYGPVLGASTYLGLDFPVEMRAGATITNPSWTLTSADTPSLQYSTTRGARYFVSCSSAGATFVVVSSTALRASAEL